MSKERQGEIALIAIKDIVRKQGIKLADIRRNVNAETQRLGVPAKDLMEFQEIIYRELFEEAFAKA